MTDFNSYVERTGLPVVRLQSASLGTSSTQILSDIPFKAIHIHNPNASKTLSYSFDNSVWFKVFPLGTDPIIEVHNNLYVKGSASSTEYQIRYAKNQ